MRLIRNLARKSIKYSVSAFKTLSGWDDLLLSEKSFTYKQLNAFYAHSGLSKMLLYDDYKEIETGVGIYRMADKRHGFILQITPPAYLGENTEKRFRNLIATLAKDGYVLHIMTYASENLEAEIGEFENLHHCDCNIRQKDMLRDWVKNRANSYRQWTRESMMLHTDVRLRNFVTLVSVICPYGSKKDDILDVYRTALEGLKAFSPRNFGADDLLTLCDELFRPSKRKWKAEYDPNVKLSNAIGLNTEMTFDEEDQKRGLVTIDKTRKMQAITTSKMPKDITLTAFQQLFYDVFGDEIKLPIPSPYMISMTISAKNLDKTAEDVREDAVHNKDQLRKMGMKDIDQHPQFGDRYQECDDTIFAIVDKGERLFNTSLQFFVFDEDQAKLDRNCKALIEKFKLADNGGWYIEKEKHSLYSLITFLYSLPLMHLDFMEQTHLEPRFNKRWTSNNAKTAPIVSDAKGFGKWRFVTVGRSGQFQRLDWRAGSNQNIVIIGPMGVGKSFFNNELVVSSLSQGAKIRSFDLGDSMKEVCINNGGKHIAFKKNTNTSLNFFTHIPASKRKYFDEDQGKEVYDLCIEPDALITTVPIVGLMCKLDLKSTYSDNPAADIMKTEMSIYIQKAIEKAFFRKKYAAGMEEVYNILLEMRKEAKSKGYNEDYLQSLIVGLYNYGHPNGLLYSYLNGPNTIDFSDNDFAVFEYKELQSMGDLLYVAQATIMQKIATEFYYLPRELPKMFGIDEGKVLALGNPVMMSYIEEFSLTLRKYKADFYIATQATAHFDTPEAKNFYSLAAWKIFLPRNETDIETDIKSGMLALSPFEKKLMASLQYNPPDFSEFYVQSGKLSMVCRLKVDAYSYWLYTTNPEDIGTINNTEKEYGYTKREAITYLANLTKTKNHDLAVNAVEQLRLEKNVS
ncbi:MAG: TraC family protein [Campylobacterales bacterium]|nr:TraC family protein [Campylobacterales bacterium]